MIEIPLTRGYVAIVDDEDADLAQYKWCADKHGYAVRNLPNRKQEYMHCVIFTRATGVVPKPEEDVDHTDRVRQNNRRQNLRIALHRFNVANQNTHKNNTSGYKGVGWHKRAGKWRSRIKVNGINYHLGLFISKHAAAIAYNNAAIKFFGAFAAINIIEKDMK